MSVQHKKAFTIIELVVIIAIIAILALLAIPKFMNYTREAEFTRLTYDARLLENACEQYYLDHGDWPRASDTPYTAEQVNAFAQKVYDRTGKVIVLDPEGKYYDIDMQKLGRYVTINSDPRNFVLQNPVGSVYILDPQTNTKLQEPKIVQKPVAVITMTPNQGLTTATKITWDYSQSYDPNGYAIVNAEWEGKQDQYTTEGEYTVKLRVQNSKGIWSDWANITFCVNAINIQQIVAGGYYTAALKKDHTVWTWGGNWYGELGDGSFTKKYVPVQVKDLANIIAISCNKTWNAFSPPEYTLSLRNDGTVWAWGCNNYGQLGDGTTTTRPTPVQVKNLTNVIAVSTGWAHSLALKSDGTVWAWGQNNYGQLGDGTTTNKCTPVQIQGLTDIIAISANGYHSLALKKDGTVWAWGCNDNGQLGDGTTTSRRIPVQVKGVTGAIAISAGDFHSLALKSNGTVWAWGANNYGQLGDDTTINRTIPVQTKGLTDVISISAGYYHSLALKSNGTVWAWGCNKHDNCYGYLGDGTMIDRHVPVQVYGLTNVIAISAGSWHSVALRNDGTVWAWGYNYWGELGDGSTVNSSVPVQVQNLN